MQSSPSLLPNPTPGSSAKGYPLTPAQMDIWLEQSLHPESTQFAVFPSYDLPLAVDVVRFLAATNLVFATYEALYARLTQAADGTPLLVFDPRNAPLCDYLDLSAQPDPQAALEALQQWLVTTPPPLFEAPLAFPGLVRLAKDHFCYFCRHHHLVTDAWGAGIVFPRIAQAYEEMGRGLEPALPGSTYGAFLEEAPLPLTDLQRAKATAFWTSLEATPGGAAAPYRTVEDLATSSCLMAIPRDLADRVTRVAEGFNATLFHALLLAIGILDGLDPDPDSRQVTLPVLNRSREYRETIGFFTELRTIPLPLDEAAPVGDNLQAISRRFRELLRHYRVPDEDRASLLHPRGATPNRTLLSYITRDYSATLDGIATSSRYLLPIHQGNPLVLYVLDTYPGQAIQLKLLYHDRHMNPQGAQRHLLRMINLLEAFCADPGAPLGDLDPAPPEERDRIRSILQRQGETVLPQGLVLQEILARAQRAPGALAVESLEGHLTYAQCLDRARGLAKALVEGGVAPGDTVALLVPRGLDLVPCYLAVMMAGAAFVPMDPSGPALRARRILEDCGARILVTVAALEAQARELHPQVLVADRTAPLAGAFPPRNTADQVAYIIYTSGSTGSPKGVEITHGAMADHLASWFHTIPMGEACERVLVFYSPAFDASIESTFPALMHGNTLFMAPHPTLGIPEMARLIRDQALTVLNLAPAYLLAMLKSLREEPGGLRGHQVRLCLTGGDVMHPETAEAWPLAFGPYARLFNIYGPTEATVTAAIFEVPPGFRPTPGESVPIGRAHKGRILRIVDGRGRDVPMGVEGELLIGGVGLARGYRGLALETGERFVLLEDGIRYYRSGDVVRLRGDGNLVFRRRLDTQVQIRGFRVEPGEVESCLLAHPAVREGAVVACPCQGDGEPELRAFLTLVPGSREDPATLRAYLQARLPSYMIPSLDLLEKLPKGTSDKIDRRALAQLPCSSMAPSLEGRAVAPQGPVQEYLAFLWKGVLGKAVDDVRADFFAQGGHSLMAVTLIASIAKNFRVEFPFASFFADPSLGAIERKLEQLVGNRLRLEKMAKVRLELARLSPAEIQERLKATSPSVR